VDKRDRSGAKQCRCPAEEREDSREGEGEVEALAQAPEHDEGSRREGARGHLTEGRLEAAGRALAVEAAVGAVGAGATVAADAGHAAPGAAVHLAVLTCGERAGRLGTRPGPGARTQRPPTHSSPQDLSSGLGQGSQEAGVCGAAGNR